MRISTQVLAVFFPPNVNSQAGVTTRLVEIDRKWI